MRKFIYSDLHGNGNMYHTIMSYLDNISKQEEIILYINGDLIDRGLESADMLLDIKKRIEENKFKIIYLGGNHELMMHQVFKKRKKGIYVSPYNDWYENGGWITDDCLADLLDFNQDKILEVADFVSNLKIYHTFTEKLNGKNIVLVHAATLKTMKDPCTKKIKDDDSSVTYAVWTRERGYYSFFGLPIIEDTKYRIGHDDYFSIVGHDPNKNKYGFEYHEDGNYLNIDGGCARYVSGLFEYDHTPLVEILDNSLRIITFNNNNEIIYGNYFINNKIIPFTEEELDKERNYLDKTFKPKKLILLPDNIVGYEDWKR